MIKSLTPNLCSKLFIFSCLISFMSCFMVISCVTVNPEDIAKLPVDLDNSNSNISQSELDKWLVVDSMIPVFSNEYVISELYNKTIFLGEDIYILDSQQNKIFKYNIVKSELIPIVQSIGHAKNEYIRIHDFGIDKKGCIYIYDSSSNLVKIYDSKGMFIKSFEVISGEAIAVADNGNVAINANSFESDTEFAVYSPAGKLLSEIKYDQDEESLSQYVIGNTGSVASLKNDFVYSLVYDNSIYRFSNGKKDCLFRCDFGKYNYDGSFAKSSDYRDFLSRLKNSDHMVTNMKDISFYNKYLFMHAMGYALLFDINTRQYINLTNLQMPYYTYLNSYGGLSIDKNGRFCGLISSNSVKSTIYPIVNAKFEGEPSEEFTRVLTSIKQVVRMPQSNKEPLFWLTIGHFK